MGSGGSGLGFGPPVSKKMRKDILIDETGDLVIENGDFKIGPSDLQHVVLLVNTAPGSWKRYPTVGVGIQAYQSSSGTGATLKQSINLQMTRDGYSGIEITLQENENNQFDYFINADFNE